MISKRNLADPRSVVSISIYRRQRGTKLLKKICSLIEVMVILVVYGLWFPGIFYTKSIKTTDEIEWTK